MRQADRLAERTAQQVRHPGDQLVGLDRLGVERLAARVRQQAVGQGGGALGAAQGRRGQPMQARLFGQAALQGLEIAGDDGQEVVEIVRHAAGQLADRLHLLGLAQRLLGAAVLGGVPDQRERADDRAVGAVQRREGRVVDADAAGLGDVVAPVVQRVLAAGERAAPGVLERGADAVREGLAERAAQHRAARHAGHRLHRRVPQRVAPLGVDRDDRLGRAFDHQLGEFLLAPQRGLGVAVLVDLGDQLAVGGGELVGARGDPLLERVGELPQRVLGALALGDVLDHRDRRLGRAIGAAQQ